MLTFILVTRNRTRFALVALFALLATAPAFALLTVTALESRAHPFLAVAAVGTLYSLAALAFLLNRE